ncbi:MAG TPA: M14 family metallopeptidase [Steroidobacteraceae bacterium]|nr:M14 family metallopeptidase [Steroidobacteraceae bacterium]
MDTPFSNDYREAREKFLSAAQQAGAELGHFRLDARAPDGLELATDIAWLGAPTAKGVLVTLSGTHGVEGFFGSATQTEWLRRFKPATLCPEIAALHVHAINPYGFAWMRRSNETNVDINRNWVDFNEPPKRNERYDELSADLCPADWSAASQAQTGARLMAWMKRQGPNAEAIFQQAVSGGQWHHPLGLFYGGTEPSWSRRTLTEILTARLAHAERACVLDFHTGLGPYGYAEPIIGLKRDAPGFARIRSWIGGGARSLHGESVSAEIVGDSLGAIPDLLRDATVDCVALECGIKPINEVALALRADAWLHAYGDPLSPQGRQIQRQMRDAFHSDDPLWQGMALGQGLAACQAALGELTSVYGKPRK